MKRIVAKLARLNCDCFDGKGVHYVDLFDPEWESGKTRTYDCVQCGRPLIIHNGNGRFYYVGQRVR